MGVLPWTPGETTHGTTEAERDGVAATGGVMWENKGYEDRGRMSIDTPFRGSLFANDFLCESIIGSPDWQAIDDSALDALKASVRDVFDGFPIAGSPNESQTEDDLIWPVLLQLGWKASLRQQNLSAQGREDVPDGLLFTDAAAKDRANGFTEEWKRYEFGLAVVESKRWLRPLDRRSGRRGEASAQDCPEPQFEANSFVTVTFRPNPEVRAKAEERSVDRVAGEVRLLQVMSG